MSNLTPAQIAELDQQTALIDEHVDVLLSAVLLRLGAPKDTDEDVRRELIEAAITTITSINEDPHNGILFALALASGLATLMCVHYDTHSIDLEHLLEIHHKDTSDISTKFREIQARGRKGCDPNAQTAD